MEQEVVVEQATVGSRLSSRLYSLLPEVSLACHPVLLLGLAIDNIHVHEDTLRIYIICGLATRELSHC